MMPRRKLTDAERWFLKQPGWQGCHHFPANRQMSECQTARRRFDQPLTPNGPPPKEGRNPPDFCPTCYSNDFKRWMRTKRLKHLRMIRNLRNAKATSEMT